LTYYEPVRKPIYQREWLFSAVSVGSILILFGLIYLLYPGNLIDDAIKFMYNFTLTELPSTNISLPIPLSLSSNVYLYYAVFEFCIGVGVIESIILALRVMFNSSPRRIAETVGNIVAWFGTGYLVYAFLVTAPSVSKWFVFWAGIIIILGLSLVARAFVDLGYKWKKRVATYPPQPRWVPPPPIFP
jgi:hypothetical protein